jgi:hypothetical protein
VLLSFSTTNGRASNSSGFYSVHRILPYLTASFDHIGLLDGSGHLFDPFLTVLKKFLLFLSFGFL